MPDWLEKAQLYRNKAQALRLIARQWIGRDTYATIGEVAQQYEIMAQRLERSAGTDDPLQLH